MISKIELRPWEPSDKDANALAKAFDHAADGLFSALFGKSAISILSKASLIKNHGLSGEFSTLAEKDGVIVGVLHGLPGNKHDDSDTILAKLAGIKIWRARLISLPLSSILSSMYQHQPNEWYLHALSVSPNYQKQGIGKVLIAAAFEQARKLGAKHLALDVAASNTSAISLYKKFGLEIVSTTTMPRIFGKLAIHRMSVDF